MNRFCWRRIRHPSGGQFTLITTKTVRNADLMQTSTQSPTPLVFDTVEPLNYSKQSHKFYLRKLLGSEATVEKDADLKPVFESLQRLKDPTLVTSTSYM